jgi:PAS domain S-box-containing protein
MNNDQPDDRGAVHKRPRETFETVFEHANDAIFIVDLENDSIVDCNPAAEELVEFSREELLSMPASNLHPHNLEEFMNFAGTVIEEGEGWTDDITCYCKSGDILPAEMSASVVEIDGRPHLINHIRETTGKEERDWFEALIEHSNDLLTVINPDGSIRYQSLSIDHVLGYEPDELRDESLFDFLHPDDQPEVRDLFGELSNAENGLVRRLEYRFRRADGSWAWLETVVSYRPESPITGYVFNARDITARKESQQQAAVLNRMLRHNLRNGLQVISGHAQGIADHSSPDLAEKGDAILSKADELLDQSTYTKDLADILEMSSVTRRSFDLEDLVEEAVERLAAEYPAASFEVDISSDHRVMGAPKLETAINHVLRNAVEHNDSDSKRVVVTSHSVDSESSEIQLAIADNGPGIPDQEKEVLLDGTETPLKHGSGLGLWIVNWIVTRTGGHITFEQNEPRGSRVLLTLPSVEES